MALSKTALWWIVCLCLLRRNAVGAGAGSACRWESVSGSAGDDSEHATAGGVFCHLRTLQPAEWESQIGRLSPLRLERTSQLNIECSDVLFFESALEEETFRRMPRIRDLSISSCKVREIQPGALASIPDLKRLSIRTHNTDWPAMALTLTPESFRGLRELRTLDLSDNSLLSTADGLFCSLSSLSVLNLSSNRLQDVSTLRLDGDCLPELHSLDLSWNSITELIPFSMKSLKQLQSLSLQHNGLASIADHALASLDALRFLNLSSNQLSVLPPELFSDCRELRELDLHNNSLSVLPHGSFSGLSQLQVLDLSANSLTPAAVHRDTFAGLVRLVVLNLGRNALTRLDSAMFRDLASLQVLRLESNLIESIDADAFLPLYNLHTLDLSNNRMTTLNDRILGGLFVLSSLSLSHNQIDSVSHQAFRNCSGLRDLDLSANALTAVPESVTELSLLKSLDLSGNRIATVATNVSLAGLQQLYSLNLADNHIRTVSKDAMSGLANLVALNLAGNRIEAMDPGALDGCAGLQVLRLDDNLLGDVNGLFAALPNLRWLNVSANRIQVFDYSFLPANVEWLDIHQNQLAELGNYFQIELANLQAIDASYNRLTALGSENVPDSVVELFLNNNLMEQIAPNTFLRKANLSRVDLNSNRFSSLEPAALWLSPVPAERELPEFSLGDNPWVCDCGLEWLPPLVQPSSQSRQQPRLVDAADITCRMTFNRRMGSANGTDLVPLVDVRPEEFLCSYETHCFALCHCCDFDACDCEMTCPTGCRCYHDPTWSANIVDCSAEHHASLPDGIPMDATELYLDGNALGELSSHAFIGRKNLRALYLNASGIHTLRNRTFHGLGSLQVLHLEHNQLEEIRGSEFEPLDHLRELYLHDNQLRFIADTTFVHLRSLQVLRLDGNRLLHFAMWRLSANPHLEQLRMAHNPWSCECRYLSDLQLWARNNPDKLSDLSEFRCLERDNAVPFAQFNATCSDVVATAVFRQNAFVMEYLPVLLSVVSLLALALVLLIVGFVYRKDLRICIYWRYGIRICGDKDVRADSGDAKPESFDAFVAYSLKDEQFVSQVLAAELEHGPQCYRMCLQHRDFPTSHGGAQTGAVGDPLTLGLAASRRIILIVSQSFIESEWTRPEVRAALTGFLRKPEKRVVAILLSAKLAQEADPELSRLLASSIQIRWGERRFWPKVRYYLPNPQTRHYIQNLHSGGLWYQANTAKSASQSTVTLTNKSSMATLPTGGEKPKAEVYWEIGNGANQAGPVPRRYTCTPHTAAPHSSWNNRTNCDQHSIDDSNQSVYSGRSQCYSRLEHSYMSIDHGHEHIYSCVQDPPDAHHHPDCWSYRTARSVGTGPESTTSVRHFPMVHHNPPGPRPPIQRPDAFTPLHYGQHPTFLV